MLPTTHRIKLDVPPTDPIAATPCKPQPRAGTARRRGRTLAAVLIATAMAAASAGCPAPAPTEPPPKTPLPPLSQAETDRCAGDAGTAGDCLPEGCMEALSPDASPENDPEPNCDELLGD